MNKSSRPAGHATLIQAASARACKLQLLCTHKYADKIGALHSGSVKAGDEFSAGRFFFLHEPVFDAAVEEIIFHFFVFFRCNFPVQFRVFVGTAAGNVLVHEAEHHIPGLKGLRHPVNDAFRVFQISGQYQVADDDAALHDTISRMAFRLMFQ